MAALPPIDLGRGVRIEMPVLLAPMSGVTDLPFRRLAKQLGAGMVVSEMIASWAMIRENRNTLRMAIGCPQDRESDHFIHRRTGGIGGRGERRHRRRDPAA